VPDNWYSHVSKPVCEHEDITILWNQCVKSDREVLANRPDVTIKNKKERICTLIDASVPLERNVTQKKRKRN
jgi:hypothetical protein